MITATFPHVASPAWLLLLAALPLLAWRHHRHQAFGALTYSQLPAGSGRRWRLHLPFYARLLALACLIGALARPQLGYAWEESLTEGIDIQIILDISGSMGAEDFHPKDRLTVAKQVVRDFVADRAGDRIGLIVFSGESATRAPLTTDRQMLATLIDSVELSNVPGTAIGVALASGAARLKTSPAKTRIAVLITDGDNNAGEIDPVSAAAACAGLGIKVYTIGVGSNRPTVLIPRTIVDPVTGRSTVQRIPIRSVMNEGLLREIGRRTGGQFFRATDSGALREIFAEIDRLEKTPLKVQRYVRYREAFPPLAWAGLALLLLPLAAAGVRITAEP
ncbi:MAG TPA: VWA domain-containing protein [Thermoanaerobaculia bacterium]|nr:VWA domain-containing protein [Thermoanaerobaculia bacterium]